MGRAAPSALQIPTRISAMPCVMNRLGFYPVDDPREKALRDAVYRAMAAATAERAA